jgi:hypothetical protein
MRVQVDSPYNCVRSLTHLKCLTDQYIFNILLLFAFYVCFLFSLTNICTRPIASLGDSYHYDHSITSEGFCYDMKTETTIDATNKGFYYDTKASEGFLYLTNTDVSVIKHF